MTQGRTESTLNLFNPSRDYCERNLPANSIYRLLFEHGDTLFPDVFFEDLFSTRGRHSVPPRILATVMVLQRLEGLSDREAVERFMFDARWKFACGGLESDYAGFGHTVLVYMRARLRASDRPTRIFDAVLDVARASGTLSVRRVLDSTPLYDAVATQDTVTLIRSAIRGVLKACDHTSAEAVRGLLERDDPYDTPGKPVCDWNDSQAREQLIDALARDGYAVTTYFNGKKLAANLDEAVRLLATILGQDIEEDNTSGLFRIIKGVARDRVISTVDPQTRHGHKTASRRFDGYKGHIAIDPDSEIITSTVVTAGNVGDAAVVQELIQDLMVPEDKKEVLKKEKNILNTRSLRKSFIHLMATLGTLTGWRTTTAEPVFQVAVHTDTPMVEVYGDAAYGAANVLYLLDQAGIGVFTKIQHPVGVGGRFSLNHFEINIAAQTVTCPAKIKMALYYGEDGSGYARFGKACATCPLREQCTTSKSGRTINLHPKFELLQQYRHQQTDPQWQEAYRKTRPKVERKLAHMVRRKHGGRRARMRGTERIAHDFNLLAAATNLARLAQLGLTRIGNEWTTAH